MRRSQIVALSLGTAAVVVAAAIAWDTHLLQDQAAPPVGVASVTQPAPTKPVSPTNPAVASSQLAPAPGPAATPGAPPSPPALAPTLSPASPSQTMAESEPIPPENAIAPPAIDLAPTLPQFDTVRVEPSGEAVIAGHGQPDAQVALLANGSPIAEEGADGAGNFVIIPTPFAPGNYELTLRSERSGKPPRVSVQVVTVSVPARGQKNLVVAVAEPGKPTKVLADTAAAPPPAPTAAAPSTSPAATVDETPSVAFKTAEVERDGFYASGTATPAGEHLNLYLNDTHLAELESAADDHWSLRVKRGLTPGHYTLRADALNTTLNKVVARAEVAFDVPLLVATTQSNPPSSAAAPAQAEAPPRPPSASAPPAPSPSASAATPPATSASAPPPPAPGASASASSPPAPDTKASAMAAAAPPAAQTSSAPMQQASSEPPAPASTSNDAVVPDINTATVAHGDSLWRISRKIFGRGIRYTVIYEANAAQIRNPNLIYPGQIFVVPPNK